MLAALLILHSCIDRDEYPIVPYIEFSDFYVVIDQSSGKETGVIVLSFTDGDGDIGLAPKDTVYPYQLGGDYYYNYIMYFYKKQGTEFVKIETPYYIRIPVINPDEFPQNLDGEIYINIDVDILRTAVPDGIFKFDAFIYDRALHKSNTIMSPVIQLD